LGVISLEKGLLQASINYFTEDLEQGKLGGDTICIACAKRGMGRYFAKVGDLESSIIALNKSITAFDLAGDVRGAEEVRKMLSSLHS
jgi:hypothetical protein